MVDMGNPFTFMERSIYDVVAEEFEKQMLLLNSTRLAGSVKNLGPICFNVSDAKIPGSYPNLTFQSRVVQKSCCRERIWSCLIEIWVLNVWQA